MQTNDLKAVFVILAFALIAVVSVLGVWSSLIHMQMVDRLNERLPVERRFFQLWWSPLKRLRFLNEYEREFPHDPMRKRLRFLTIAGFVCIGAILLDMLMLR